MVFTLLMGSSCSGDFLDRDPADGVERDEAITNYARAINALTGVYDALQGNSDHTTYYGAGMIYYGDVRGTDMQSVNSGKRTSACYEMTYTVNSNAPEIWEDPYRLIRRANSLIQAIDNGQVKDAEQSQINHIKGQALAMRALAHFDLSRVYSKPYYVTNGTGLGIPIVLTPTDYASTPGRNTLEEVYNQVIKDLKESVELMNGDKNTGYFNKWAAEALLARVYLYMGDNVSAYKTAVDVINNSSYKLWTSEDYVAAWGKVGTSEVLMEIVNASNADWVDRESIGYLYAEEGYEDAIMTKNYVDFAQTNYPGDVRLDVMLRTSLTDKEATEAWGTNKVYINKYPGRDGDVRINNIPILRLSECYLIAAEAAVKLGDSEEAAKYLNAIVLRGNPNATAVPSGSVTLDRVLAENRIEFIGEGHRFFDLMRNTDDAGKPLQIVRYSDETNIGWNLPLTVESRSFNVDYFRAILPIPSDEVSANPVIAEQQNPGY